MPILQNSVRGWRATTHPPRYVNTPDLELCVNDGIGKVNTNIS